MFFYCISPLLRFLPYHQGMIGGQVHKTKTQGHIIDWSNTTVENYAGTMRVQGIQLREGGEALVGVRASQKGMPQDLTHKDKAAGYVQTSGQLMGALGLVVSGLLEGNLWRASLGGLNSLRSTFKLASDVRAKSRSSTHKNDVKEGAVAASTNSVGIGNVRSFEEALAVAMGITAWATKGITAFIHMKREQNLEQEQAEMNENDAFFANNPVQATDESPSLKVGGYFYRGLQALKDASLEGGFFIMAHAPPVMMAVRAVSYLQDGVNNNDVAMAGGGASFILGAVLMMYKDHKSYMKARHDRQAKAEEAKESLKTLVADQFEEAEGGPSLTSVLTTDDVGYTNVDWGVDIDEAYSDYSKTLENSEIGQKIFGQKEGNTARV